MENEADAEDTVSNAILKTYENREQVSAFHKFKPWMLAITKNEALKIKKKKEYSCVAFYAKECYNWDKSGWLFSIGRFTDESY